MTPAKYPVARLGNVPAQLRRFGRDEDGTLIIFTLCLFVLMCMMGGFAIDLMRYETSRTALQNSLDRCTLMAASLRQTLDPKSVVVDCMDKMDMADEIEHINVVEGFNSRNVISDGRVDTKPIFLHMMGIDKFDAIGHSAALQAITDVEIVLVLDVSGSMGDPSATPGHTKIQDLKTAAAEFVDTMIDSDPDHRVSITIVPYNAQVNLGPVLRAKYNAVNQHGVADVNCLEVPAASYSSLALPRTLAIPMMAYADIAYSTNQVAATVSATDATYAKPNYDNAFCKPTTVNVVRLPSQDKTVLKAQINALQQGGNTSIMLGMKWGVSLLDPSARPMFSELISEGKINSKLAGRPFDYTNKEAMKVIVLMTDGEHVAHDRVTDAFKTGASDIYKSTSDGQYSVRITTGRPAAAGTNEYWVPHLGTWRDTPYPSAAGATMQNWEDIWANLKLTYVAWQFYARAIGTDANTTAANNLRNSTYSSKLSAMRATFASVAKMNSQLQQSCTLAKAQKVTIYGIAFQAPTNGQTQISSCATSPSHYFNAQGLGIQSAFRAIASNLTQLKLTQ